jgi:putative DNA primase/helicase
MNPPVLPPLSMEPTKDQAVAALELLKSLLVEFPFADEVSRSVALSALITPVVRVACPAVPAHGVTAPGAGSGKSYLFNIVAAICIGNRCPVMTVARSEAETEKRIASAVIAGQPIIALDNVDVVLGGAFLSQAISEEMLLVRKLGFSEQLLTSNNWCVFVTGNNLTFYGDVTRRVILAEVNAGMERPELREFKARPFERVVAERGRFIAAALTVVLGYRAAGMPGKVGQLASFEAWSDLVRSALIWLDQPDPVVTMERVREEDPELRTTRQVFAGMAKQFGVGEEHAKFSSEIIDSVMGMDPLLTFRPSQVNMLKEGLKAVAGPNREINTVILGVWLSKKVNYVVDGLRLCQRADNHLGTLRWWVEPLEGGAVG